MRPRGQTNNPATYYAIVVIAYHAAHQNEPHLARGLHAHRPDLEAALLPAVLGGVRLRRQQHQHDGLGDHGAEGRRQLEPQRARPPWPGCSKQASASGGFSYRQGGSPDADDTAAVVQALRAGGVRVIVRGDPSRLGLPAFAAAQQRGSGVRLRGGSQRRVHRLDHPGRRGHRRQPRRLLMEEGRPHA